MSKIRIKNFGPIKEGFSENGGYIDIEKITMFIGNQGSGKSTIAKLISSFTWLEKALNRGDVVANRGINILNLISWQRLGSYMSFQQSEIEYIGDKFKISYIPNKTPSPIIESVNGEYTVPKIMYVPSERNFLSTIKGAFDISGLPGPLASFAEELKRAQIELSGDKLELPFQRFAYEYDEYKDISYVIGNNYKIDLLEASSGLHSLIPLFIVSRNLTMKIRFENVPSLAPISANQSVRRDREVSTVMMNKSLTSTEKEELANQIYSKYHNKCFINIVEEPEQNLFPTSQRAVLNYLLACANNQKNNKLIITTHSPYIINFLSVAIQGNDIMQKLQKAGKFKKYKEQLEKIIPIDSTVNASDVAVYQLDENNGTIHKLPNYHGIPSDKNYLNEILAEGNYLFDSLFEIEEEL